MAGRTTEIVTGCGLGAAAGEIFRDAVAAFDPSARARWISQASLDDLSAARACHRPDPFLSNQAHYRLRAGPARYCLTGVTHTTAIPAVMAELAALSQAPLMPWDAIICTSEAVAETVRRMAEREADYLRWRHGAAVRRALLPQLPVIPLGVFAADFAAGPGDRAAARAALGVGGDEVLALFVGRLTFAEKAHPQAMYEGLQRAAERTGRRVALLECGWSPLPAMEEAFASVAAAVAPDVRRLVVDGREPEALARSWAAADLFVSLSDNLQETFGLTPLEAMAAGLPVVASDWDGYRDTVRSGVDGFLIPTWAPAAGHGEALASRLEAGLMGYRDRNWEAAAATSVDMATLVDALSALVGDPDLRRTMGEAARRRAATDFDWARIYARYQALWDELDARRLAVMDDPDALAWLAAAPRSAPAHPDPFEAFGHYPSHAIDGAALVALTEGGDGLERFRRLAAHPLWPRMAGREPLAAALIGALAEAPATVAELGRATRMDPAVAVTMVGVLAKMGIVALGAP